MSMKHVTVTAAEMQLKTIVKSLSLFFALGFSDLEYKFLSGGVW